MNMKFITGCATSAGGYRRVNQDSILLDTKESFAFGVVCDGIGGLDNSELASTFVADAAAEWYHGLVEWLEPETAATDIIFSHLRDAAEDWNYRLCEYIRSEGLRCGTTMSLISLLRDSGLIIHVGDSRIYRYRRDSGLDQLTVDMVTSKMSGGRMKTYLANYVGRQDELSYLPIAFDISPDELYIFGSDGFYHKFTEQDAERVYYNLSHGDSPKALCHELISAMISRGEHDNISVGLIYTCR